MQTNHRLLGLKTIFSFLFFLCLNIKGIAHSPDLSSLIIYEQNGKYFLAIKSSLTAFEGEIDYHFNKNAYKTPEEFQQLISKHFQKKCLLIINNDTIKFINTTVVLGHETTVFAELTNVSQKINSFYLKNDFFADFPNNLCELVFTIKGYPQKQYILQKENLHQVKLLIENNSWIVIETANSFTKTSSLIIGGILSIGVIIVLIIVKNKKKNIS
jgi:hypothetical protein